MRSRFRPIAALLLLAGLVAGCQSHPAEFADVGVPLADRPMDYSRDMPAITPPDWARRGTVLSTSEENFFDMTALPAGATVKTFTYQSISGITGIPTVVGGGLFLPPGAPPPGGWPVIGNAHFTTGVTPDCGTLDDAQLSGGLPTVGALVTQGYAVAYTDYAGLGPAASADNGNEVHPYLEPKSAAFNLIDAVRAARALTPELSSRWVSYGASQGGQAAWAAAEYFPTYGEGTELLGAVALVPALDVSAIGELAETAELNGDQKSIYPIVIAGLAAVDPGIHPDEFMTGALRRGLGAVVACQGPDAQQQDAVLAAVRDSDFTVASPEAAGRLTRRLESYRLPQRPTTTPILVVYGGADPLVQPEWTDDAITRACALGDNITRVRLDDEGHDLDPGRVDDEWIAARFAGVPVTGDC